MNLIVTPQRESVAVSRASWQALMRTAIRDSHQLRRVLDLPPPTEGELRAAASFPVLVPRTYLAKMRPGDPADPLLRQVLSDGAELVVPKGFTGDPVGDEQARRGTRLLKKYNGRALLVTTGACAVHCRYCFRRHFPYPSSRSQDGDWEDAVQELRDDDTVKEVILSGGDPLMLVDSRLETLIERLADIDHLKRLRIHSRLPVIIPQRITPSLVSLLRSTRLTCWFVIHANHPREVDDALEMAAAKLIDEGIPVLNQSVLLWGVNDDAETLAELCERLIDARIAPYYLHQLDRVAGAGHFEVPVERGLELMAVLRDRLPGYAVPQYVREIRGAAHKVPLA